MPEPSKGKGTAPPAPPSKPGGPGKTPARPDQGRRIEVHLEQQRAVLFEHGKITKRVPISSGRPGHETPTGSFRIQSRVKDHRSRSYGHCVGKDGKRVEHDRTRGGPCPKGMTYEGAPMPYYQRITPLLGFHQGRLPGRPASHGCIRLSEEDARFLWEWASVGTPVTVHAADPGAPAKKKR